MCRRTNLSTLILNTRIKGKKYDEDDVLYPFSLTSLNFGNNNVERVIRTKTRSPILNLQRRRCSLMNMQIFNYNTRTKTQKRKDLWSGGISEVKPVRNQTVLERV